MRYLPDFSKTHIIVIGDIMLDRYFWGDVERISPEAPVPVVKISRKTQCLGGAGNVAMNLAGLKCQLFLLAICGQDDQGNHIDQLLTQAGVDHHLITAAHHPTTTKTRVIGQGQQLLRLDEEKTNTISPEMEEKLLQAFDKNIYKTKAVVLSDYGKGIFNGDIAGKIIARCRNRHIPIFVDPKGNNWQRYHGASCITPNENEFHLVAPFDRSSSADLAAKAEHIINEINLNHLLVTRGAKGMSLFSPGQTAVHIPTKAREVFDVSGAGDTVIAVLAAGIACGLSMDTAARLANAAAGVVVGKLGTHAITAEDLKQAILDKGDAASSKIVDRRQAQEIAEGWRQAGEKIVFTNGCFDILHIGHMKIMRSAAGYGSKLIVGLNSDASVARLKGSSRPVVPENDRASLLSNIESVDLVVIFGEETPLELIKELKPHVLVKGGDYTPETVVGAGEVESWGGEVAIVPLLEGLSTTQIIKKMNSNKG